MTNTCLDEEKMERGLRKPISYLNIEGNNVTLQMLPFHDAKNLKKQRL